MTCLIARMAPTWPPARMWRQGPWMLRDGAGGGGRVSAATLEGEYDGAPPPLVMVRGDEARLDAALADLGYTVEDESVTYCAPVGGLAGASRAVAEWPVPDVTLAMWALSGKVGPPRLAVMDRVAGRKCVIAEEGGAGFVALNGDLAVLHALEVAQTHRRRGIARDLLRGAALWAQQQGAAQLALVVTTANHPARALYVAAGMTECGRYHYRKAAA
ncbi:GNAT family N-acetyltransferase [Falsirhodobacter deserti]|uniref:GNAT family N-acetyltransferase n=1 Tax=Falsirhodobacter deserti TaxID=1365611 RepID=UPI000FE34D24|nr:GNAT family N-acetyltransferase [Falsirhodobacter deserti]